MSLATPIKSYHGASSVCEGACEVYVGLQTLFSNSRRGWTGASRTFELLYRRDLFFSDGSSSLFFKNNYEIFEGWTGMRRKSSWSRSLRGITFDVLLNVLMSKIVTFKNSNEIINNGAEIISKSNLRKVKSRVGDFVSHVQSCEFLFFFFHIYNQETIVIYRS